MGGTAEDAARPFSLLLSLLADLEKDESRDDENHETDSDDHLSVHAFRPPSSF